MGAPDQPAQPIPDPVATFLGKHNTVTLATASPEGVPHATTLVYANDGWTLYIWVHASSNTASLIDRNPLVGFTIDEYTDDWRETRGVQGNGECAPVTDGEELARAGDLFGGKFPMLRPGASGAVTFYRITPREIVFIDNTIGTGPPEPDEYRRQSIIGP